MIEESIENLDLEKSIAIFEDICKKTSNDNIFKILTLSVIFNFDDFLEYIGEKHFKCIENNIDLFSYFLLHSDKFTLSDKFYISDKIDYSTDNYKLLYELIKNNKIQAVKFILENYPLKDYKQVVNDIIKFQSLELIKTIDNINFIQEDINISTLKMNSEYNNFYHYLFFNFLEDKSVFSSQYLHYAFEENNIDLFNDILNSLNNDNYKKISITSFMRILIEENKTSYLKIILNHRSHFKLFERNGHIIHICLSLKNVDCLKLLFSYDESIQEFNNNILNSKNEYGDFLSIAKNIILLKNF